MKSPPVLPKAVNLTKVNWVAQSITQQSPGAEIMSTRDVCDMALNIIRTLLSG